MNEKAITNLSNEEAQKLAAAHIAEAMNILYRSVVSRSIKRGLEEEKMKNGRENYGKHKRI